MKTFFQALLLALYALALAGLAIDLPFGAGPALQRIALIVIAVHLIELVFAYKYLHLYRGPLAVSVALTLLYGLFHWKPLADAKRRGTAG